MKNTKNYFVRRRLILKFLGIILFIIPLQLLYSSIKQRLSFIKKNLRSTKINIDQLYNVTFIENLIIIKKGGAYSVFSARCTHLGCIIKKIENNELVCPCHGSRFSLNGEVIKGPANGKLTALNFKFDSNGEKIIVESFV